MTTTTTTTQAIRNDIARTLAEANTIADLNAALATARWASRGGLPSGGSYAATGRTLIGRADIPVQPHETRAERRLRGFVRNVAIGLALLATGIGAVTARAETTAHDEPSDVVYMPVDEIVAYGPRWFPTAERHEDGAPVVVPTTALVWECGPWVELHQGSGKARTCQWTHSTTDAVWGVGQ